MRDKYIVCPTCGRPRLADRVNNGVCYVYHMVCCGWGHDSGDTADMKRTTYDPDLLTAIESALGDK